MGTNYAQTPSLCPLVQSHSSPSELAASATQGEVFKELWPHKYARLRRASPYGHLPNWSVRQVIVKAGDDCRQELMAVQLLCEFHDIWVSDVGPAVRVCGIHVPKGLRCPAGAVVVPNAIPVGVAPPTPQSDRDRWERHSPRPRAAMPLHLRDDAAPALPPQKEAGLPLYVRPYQVLVTSSHSALIEVIPDAMSIHTVKASMPGGASLADWFFQRWRRGTPECQRAQRNFCESMVSRAAAAVAERGVEVHVLRACGRV